MPKLPSTQIVGWQFSTLGMSIENKKFYFLRFLIKSIRFFFFFMQMSDVPYATCLSCHVTSCVRHSFYIFSLDLWGMLIEFFEIVC